MTPNLYPRAHGEVRVLRPLLTLLIPLPPCTRGSRLVRVHSETPVASTPVHTGRSGRSPSSRCATCLYPRARGEVSMTLSRCHRPVPLPPRTRGGLSLRLGGVCRDASTPVHTGKSRGHPPWTHRRALYPRAHGEVSERTEYVRTGSPLPPCTRGSHGGADEGVALGASTPVHTGKSQPPPTPASSHALYPRAHGEVASQPRRPRTHCPLPPCTRGSRIGGSGRFWDFASTPVHTGKSLMKFPSGTSFGLYPRAHGEVTWNR